jgi:hypothetical protein
MFENSKNDFSISHLKMAADCTCAKLSFHIPNKKIIEFYLVKI